MNDMIVILRPTGHAHKPKHNFTARIRLVAGALLMLAIVLCSTSLSLAANEPPLSVTNNPACKGDTVTITLHAYPSDIPPFAVYDGTSVPLTGASGLWTGTITASRAGTIDVYAYDADDHYIDHCTETVVELNDFTVSGAYKATDTDYTTMTNSSANSYVTLIADVTPNTSAATNLVAETGGSPVPDQLFQWRVSKNSPLKQPLTLSSCGGSNSLTLWIISAMLKSVQFNSDHQELLNNNNDWTDAGTRYFKPEWIANTSTNNPISQTLGTTVMVTATVNVQPADLPFDLYGDSGLQSLSFSKFDNSGNISDQGINMTSDDVLTNAVAIQSGSINWTISAFGGVFSCASVESGPHTIYVTYGTPSGSIYGPSITEKRLSWVCDKDIAGGETTEHGCIKDIFNATTGLFAMNDPRVTNLWDIAGGASGQCWELVLFDQAATHMLGIPGGDEVYIYPLPGKSVKETSSWTNMEYRIIASSNPAHPTNTTHDAFYAFEKIGYQDHAQRPNKFEACFKFTSDGVTKYYAPGAPGLGIYDTPQAVMNSVSVFTFWVYFTSTNFNYSYCTNPGPWHLDDWP